MKIDKHELQQTAVHTMLTLFRLSAAYGTHAVLIADEDSVLSKTSGYTLLAAQAPGIYNQFRHTIHHATAIVGENQYAQWLNEKSHQYLPHVPGPGAVVRGVMQKLGMG